MGWGWYLSQTPLGLLRAVLIGLSRCRACKEGSCAWPLPCNAGGLSAGPWWNLCWLRECRASRDCFTLSPATSWAGTSTTPFLASRQKSSLPLSLNSQQVSCGSQPHHKQLLRQKKLATHLWDLFFWWQWLERFRCVYPRCRKRVWATDKILLCKTHTAKDSTKFMT